MHAILFFLAWKLGVSINGASAIDATYHQDGQHYTKSSQLHLEPYSPLFLKVLRVL